ncbi:hypothetical protein ACHAXA_004730 [Cyclostephanos tholiformis]|uniref:DUF7495 domain-containing protein n=1 Tax=Cyclostephanos tholiformis TaxID=382380 RepID=A0ABD3SRL5_9STRA
MSLDAFISGQSVVTPFGDHVPTATNPIVRHHRAFDDIGRRGGGGGGGGGSTTAPADAANERGAMTTSEDPIKLAERTSSLIDSYRSYISRGDRSYRDEYDDEHERNEVDEEMMLDRIVGGGYCTGVVDRSDGGGGSLSNSAGSSYSPTRLGSSATMFREWKYDVPTSSSSSATDNNYNGFPFRSRGRRMLDDARFGGDDDSLSHHDDGHRRYAHPVCHSRKIGRFVAICAIVSIVSIIAILVHSSDKGNDDVVDGGGGGLVGSSLSLEEEKEKAEWPTLLLEDEEEQQRQQDHRDDGEGGGDDNFGGGVLVQNLDGNYTTDHIDDGGGGGGDVSEDINDGTSSSMIEDVIEDSIEGEEMGVTVESITGDILCCSSSSKSALSANANTMEYEAASDAYHPVWYGRSNGWTGTTWIEALAFCSSLDDDVDDDDVFHGLCPYVAYCPMGSLAMPLGGYRDGERYWTRNDPGDRAPISDYVDGWVQVGSKDPCVEYSISGGLGALEDVDVSATSHNPEHGMGEAKEENSITNATMTTVQEEDGKEETYVPIVKPGPEYYIENEEQEEVSSSSQVQSTVDSTILLLREQFKPLWLSSAEGWNGGSYSDAASFCNSIRGKELCPYSVICPQGPGHAVMGGLREVEFVVDGEQYAPIAGGENHWVMVGDVRNANDDGTQDEDAGMSTKCMTHRQLEGKNPDWGLNGDRNDVKMHIMCCTVN